MVSARKAFKLNYYKFTKLEIDVGFGYFNLSLNNLNFGQRRNLVKEGGLTLMTLIVMTTLITEIMVSSVIKSDVL